jgi:hypothetical protein
MFSHGSDLVHTVSSVKGGTNLLISVDKSLKLDIEIFVLGLQDVAVTIESIELTFNIIVSIKEVMIVESHGLLILSAYSKLIIDGSQSVFSLKDLSSEVSMTSILTLGSSCKVRLMNKLAIQISLESMDLSSKSRVVILGSCHLNISAIPSLASPSEFKFLGVGEFTQLIRSLLSLEQVVVNSLNSGIVILALSFFECNAITKSIDLVLILGLFLT